MPRLIVLTSGSRRRQVWRLRRRSWCPVRRTTRSGRPPALGVDTDAEAPAGPIPKAGDEAVRCLGGSRHLVAGHQPQVLLGHDLPPFEPAAIGQHPGEAGVVGHCRDEFDVTHVERRVPGVEPTGGRFELDQTGVGVPVAGRQPGDAACGHRQSGVAQVEGSWGWLGKVAGPALDAGPYGQIDDDVSYTLPWGCDPAAIGAPVRLLHGTEDRIIPASHGSWLAAHCPTAELRLCPGDSHFTIVNHAESALEWLGRQV